MGSKYTARLVPSCSLGEIRLFVLPGRRKRLRVGVSGYKDTENGPVWPCGACGEEGSAWPWEIVMGSGGLSDLGLIRGWASVVNF